jgi:signal transduction histidine kinase
LVSTLELKTTLEQIARLAVPTLGDWCAVYVSDDDGATFQRATEHSTSTRSAMPPHLQKNQRFDEWAAHLVKSTVGGEKPLVMGDSAPNGESAESEAFPYSWMSLPLSVRQRCLGALVLVCFDSERRYSTEDRSLAEELARRGALAIENARLYEEAREAIRIRDVFLSVASHELKTPLTTIKGYTQILSRQLGNAGEGATRANGTIARLTSEVSRFEHLVHDLLDLSHIQQGQLRLHPELFDLTEVAKDVFSRFQSLNGISSLHSFVFRGQAPVYGVWDRNRIDQVLTNLITNALKYSPVGGVIAVEVRAAGCCAELVVEDRGIGMSQEDQATIFQPFARGREAQLRVGGSGLGLYITEQIITTHQGTISVESELGKGSKFTARLPMGSNHDE